MRTCLCAALAQHDVCGALFGGIGQYLAKTYLETKHRPIYILQESSDGTKKDEGIQS